MIDRLIELAEYAAKVIRSTPRLELMCEPQLSTVVFRYVPARTGADSDQLNATLRQRLFDRGLAVIGHTRVRVRQCLKFTCMNPVVTESQMEELIRIILRQLPSRRNRDSARVTRSIVKAIKPYYLHTAYLHLCTSKCSCRNTFSTGRVTLRPVSHSRWQLLFLPGIESTSDIDYVFESRALQQAAGDHAAVSTFAVHCNRGTSRSISGGDTLKLSSGHQVAFSMCAASHSGSRRTSSTCVLV